MLSNRYSIIIDFKTIFYFDIVTLNNIIDWNISNFEFLTFEDFFFDKCKFLLFIMSRKITKHINNNIVLVAFFVRNKEYLIISFWFKTIDQFVNKVVVRISKSISRFVAYSKLIAQIRIVKKTNNNRINRFDK